MKLLAISIGATLGAWLRWGLSLWFNTVFASLPMGTLIANLGGAFLIGIAVGVFQDLPALSPEWRLLVVTGFLGALTTFSTFSAESMLLIQKGELGWALAHSSLHLLGSLVLCIAGLATWRLIAA